MYNASVKNKYLESIENEGTAMVVEAALKRAEPTEKILEKDLSEMSLEEIKMVMKDISPYSLAGVVNYLSYYKTYIDWMAKNGYIKSNINLISLITKKEMKEFVSTVKRSNWTREELFEFIDVLVNENDKALLLAFFEGISGKGFIELGHLKKEDLSFDGEKYWANLVCDITEGEISRRTIEISRELYTLLRLADGQTHYASNNGESRAKNKEIEFIKTPYIFKLTKRTKTNRQIAITGRVVANRLHMFRRVFGLDGLRARDLIRSGMFYKAHQLYQERGVFGKEELLTIGEQFDTPLTSTRGYEPYRNITIIKRILKDSGFKEKYGYELPIE